MKKYMVLCAGLCAAVAFTSCKSSKETAYRKMYEKAQLQDQNGADLKKLKLSSYLTVRDRML